MELIGFVGLDLCVRIFNCLIFRVRSLGLDLCVRIFNCLSLDLLIFNIMILKII